MIFAVMGTTVLEPHPDNVMERTRDYKSRLSKEVTRLWDTIWHLQKDVLQSLERDIRRYVRDLQVAQMQPKLQAAIIEQAYLHSQHGSVFEAVFEDRLEEFNEHAREVARFASYPLVCARLAQANDKQAYENAVKLSFCGFNIALRHQENIYFDDVRGRTGRSLDAARRYGIDDLNYVKWRLEAHLLSSLPDTVLANEPSKTAATHH
jgi:hypothetical protein